MKHTSKNKNILTKNLLFFAITCLQIINFSFAGTQNNTIDSLNKALLSTSISEHSRADILSKIGKEYLLNENYLPSLNAYKKALSIFLQENDSLNIGNQKANIGIVYSNINDYQNSMKYFLEALLLFEKINNDSLKARTYIDMAALSLNIENIPKAFEYLNDAKRILEAATKLNSKEISKVYSMLGVAYGYSEKQDSALFCFNKALENLSEEGNELEYAGILINIGAIFSKENKLLNATDYYNKALAIFKKIDSNMGIGLSINNIAFVHLKKKEYDIAIKHYYESIDYLIKANALIYLSDTYMNLSDIYEQKEDYKGALKYYRLFVELNDSIKNQDVLSKISDMETQFEIKKKDQEIQLITKEKKLIESENEVKSKRQIILISGLLMIVVIGGLIFRNLKISLRNNQLKQMVLNQEKKQLTDDLEFKNKELESFALHIVEKNELLSQLKTELKEIDPQQPENTQRLREISHSINSNLQIDKDRKDFEFQLDNIRQSFFLKLNKLYPDLTKNEKRLCSLLVMDLSSKDIATILNISPEGIKKSRYRLRKKLNLDIETNISEFLKKI